MKISKIVPAIQESHIYFVYKYLNGACPDRTFDGSMSFRCLSKKNFYIKLFCVLLLISNYEYCSRKSVSIWLNLDISVAKLPSELKIIFPAIGDMGHLDKPV